MKSLFIGLLLFKAIFAQSSCTWTDPSGNSWDLSSVSRPGNDYTFQYTVGASTYTMYIDVCTAVSFSKCGAGVAACQQWDPNSPTGQASMGTVASGQFSALQNQPGQTGVTVSYTGGDGGRSYEIDFVCDSGAGTVYFIKI